MNINYFYVQYEEATKQFKLLGHSNYEKGVQLVDGRKYMFITVGDALKANMNPIAFDGLAKTMNRIIEEYERKKASNP